MRFHNVDTPADLGAFLLNPEGYWPDDIEQLDEEQVTIHPQGQVYIRVEDVSGPAVLYLLQLIDRAHLRAGWGSKNRLAVYEPKATCAHEDCYADAMGGRKPENPDLCPSHNAEAKRERMRQGLPPRR